MWKMQRTWWANMGLVMIRIATLPRGAHKGEKMNIIMLLALFMVPGVVRADPVVPALSTTPGGPVILFQGVPLTDSATLAFGNAPTGSIGFDLFGPTGAVLASFTATVNGNGTYSTPATGFSPTVEGTYTWRATYSGDANNAMVTAQLEVVGVNPPTITTTPGPPVVLGSGKPLTDSATLGDFAPIAGKIAWILTGPGGGGNLSGDVKATTGNGTYTTPTGVVPTVAGTYIWSAIYSDANFAALISPNEEVTVTAPPLPELSTVILLPIGIGLVLVMRKRIIQQAT